MISAWVRVGFLWAMCASVYLALPADGWTGQSKEKGWTREELIATLEKGPGPSKGGPDAPVTMVYFTDFQCGYCRKFVNETLPRIDEHYIRPGKVRLVFRHLAILGDASVQAARASACAFDQGKFWEYHDVLFANMAPLAFSAARLKRYAGDLRLNEKTFAACLDSKTFAERVEAETLIGRALGATGTPAFLINGQLLLGAYPFEAFQQGLDRMLASTPRAAPAPSRP